MNQADVLAAYDEQVRRHPEHEGADVVAERADGVVRAISATGGWAGVSWTGLDENNADTVIAREVARFSQLGLEWEWKHYSYDLPPDLPDRLRAAGFIADEPEAVLVCEIADLDLDVGAPPGVDLVPVTGKAGIDLLVRANNEAFGGDHSNLGAVLAAQMDREPDAVAAVVAMADGRPVCAGRVQFPHRGDFASIWGGGTVPEWRRRGIFRAVVAHRARLAAAKGYRYLQADASADSRPILRRLGFVELATTTPFKLPATTMRG